MPSPDADSPDDSFFNDLSQQAPESSDTRQSPPKNNGQNNAQKEDAASKTKRIACALCRKRKLKCDGHRPTCGTCKRLSHDCAYDEVRKKSGPKRGYVKLLEQRLQQVETLLKSQESNDQPRDAPRQDATSAYVASTTQQALPNANTNSFLGASDKPSGNLPESISPGRGAFATSDGVNANVDEGDFPWEMIGLGLDEPLPPQDVVNDLYQIYFSKIHPSAAVIHRPRFLAAMNLAPHMRPPVCLRYIMWTLAASVTDKYDALQEHFYQRARKYAQMDEMKGHGESTITLAHCQTWILMSTYEFKQMYFPRAWLSTGRAVRLSQMMQLHRMDGMGLDVKQCLPPPKDWTEREERRRTFWMAFCIDRYASIGTGWPMTIDEKDIMTNLPASEDAFEKSKPIPTCSLEQAMLPNGGTGLHPFGAIVVTATLFGRNLLHLHRPGHDDSDEDLNGGFWTRHRNLEQILLQTSLGLPDALRLPTNLSNPNVVFANMCIHTSAICLHQAAIFKADKHRLPVNVGNESKIRCVTAAAEIASIMRMISHLDLSTMNPFISFCVYVAARVFVQYLKTRPKDQQMNSSLQFLLQAMQALRRKNPLTESFLVQLDLDLESAGVLGLKQKPHHPPKLNNTVRHQPGCIDPLKPLDEQQSTDPILEIRECRNPNAPINTFGNTNVMNRNPATHNPANRTPDPFNLADTGMNLSQQNPSFPTSQPGQTLNLPSRPSDTARYQPGSAGVPLNCFEYNNNSEMDISADGHDEPSPATTNSQSRGASTSHTSYSPGQQNEPPANNQMPMPQPTDTNADNLMSNDALLNMFAHSDVMAGGDDMNNNFMMGSDWDMVNMGATGETGISDSSWNQMLEGINMGWDTLVPPNTNQHMN